MRSASYLVGKVDSHGCKAVVAGTEQLEPSWRPLPLLTSHHPPIYVFPPLTVSTSRHSAFPLPLPRAMYANQSAQSIPIKFSPPESQLFSSSKPTVFACESFPPQTAYQSYSDAICPPMKTATECILKWHEFQTNPNLLLLHHFTQLWCKPQTTQTHSKIDCYNELRSCSQPQIRLKIHTGAKFRNPVFCPLFKQLWYLTQLRNKSRPLEFTWMIPVDPNSFRSSASILFVSSVNPGSWSEENAQSDVSDYQQQLPGHSNVDCLTWNEENK